MTIIGIIIVLFLIWKAPDWYWEYRLSKKTKEFEISSQKRIEKLIEDRKKFFGEK